MKTAYKNPKKSLTFNKKLWDEKKSKLKEKFPQLSDTDLEFKDGQEDGLMERINSKIGDVIGKTKDGLHKFIEAI